MAKVVIYLSIADRNGKNVLHLRDTGRICGDGKIVTEVSRGDTIIWKRDSNSNLKSITALSFAKAGELFDKGPSKGCCSKWTGKVSQNAKGEYPYRIDYLTCSTQKSSAAATAGDDEEPQPPIIKVKP